MNLTCSPRENLIRSRWTFIDHRLRHENAFDLGAADLRDDHREAVAEDYLAFLGKVAEAAEGIPSDRLVAAFRYVEVELLVRLGDAHPAVHLDGVFVDGLELSRHARELLGDRTDHLLHQKLDGDDAGGAAVLVDHDRHMLSAGLHLPEQSPYRFRLGHKVGWAHTFFYRAGSGKVAAADAAQNVLDAHDSDDVVDGVLVYRKAGMRGVSSKTR